MLERGWDRVRANRGAPGKDGVTIQEFAREKNDELRTLSAELISRAYRPGPFRPVPIPKKSGGYRWLRIPCVRDRVVQAAAHELLSEGLEPEFEPWSFAYRRGHSVDQALSLARSWMTAGFDHVIDADIESFFDSVPHWRVLDKLETATDDPDLRLLVARWLDASDGVEIAPDKRGLPQGAPVSPVLANLYLDDLDETFCGHRMRMVRFADDFLILLRTSNDAQGALNELAVFLESEDLRLHPEKTRMVQPGQVLDFLGQAIVRATADPTRPPLGLLGEAGPVRLPELEPEPRTSPVPGLKPLYLYQPGRLLTRDGESFAITEGGGTAASIHHGQIGRIEVGPAGGVDADALRLAAEAGIPVWLVDGSGRIDARLSGPSDRWGARQFAQAKACLDPERATTLAQELVRAQIAGRKQLLYDIYHARTDGNSPDDPVRLAAKKLQGFIRALKVSPTVDRVAKIEAAAAKVFWPAFGLGLRNDMTLATRGRRKREKPVAILLDFASSLLLRDMEAIIQQAGLHPGFGILHTARDRGAPCAWDLAEPYRPPMIEAVVLQAINQGSIGPEDFERHENHYRMRAEGITAFIKVYEQALSRRTRCHRTGQQVSWRERMRRDAAAFVRAVETGANFTAAERR